MPTNPIPAPTRFKVGSLDADFSLAFRFRQHDFITIRERIEERIEELRALRPTIPVRSGEELARLGQRLREAEQEAKAKVEAAEEAARAMEKAIREDAPPGDIEKAEKAVALASVEAGVIEQRIALLKRLRVEKSRENVQEQAGADRLAEAQHQETLRAMRRAVMERFGLDDFVQACALASLIPPPAATSEDF